MPITALEKLSVATAVGMTLSLLTTGAANAYTFTKIADTNGLFREIFNFSSPINDQGTVAFSAILDAGGSGIFTGNGGAITTIAERTDPSFNLVTTALNNEGTVAFYAFLEAGETRLFTGSGGTITTIADTSGPFSQIGNGAPSNPAINDQGTVVFRASLRSGGEGIFISSGGVITTIADTNGPFSDFFYAASPAINNEGTVVFSAALDNGNEGIFASSGGAITTIAQTSSPFSCFGGFPLINNRGTVAFSAPLNTGSCGVVTSSNGVVTTIADTNGSFSSVSPYGISVSPYGINEEGTVALFAQLDAGGEGFFISSGAVTNKVIAIGDALFGSTVTSLYGITNGLNDSGQLSFYAALADGTQGIFRADPEPQPVPEPASILGLLTASALGVCTWRKGQQGRAL
jgi:hypothetical protein